MAAAIRESRLKSGPEDKGVFLEGQLSYIGRDCLNVPSDLGESIANNVRRLDLSFNSLRTLEGVERFPNLQELVLDNNCIADNTDFPIMPSLHTLTLNKNKIRDLDKLLDKLSASCPDLTYLSLLGNEACPDQLSHEDKDDDDYIRYRYYVLYRLPCLKFLDSTPVKVIEREKSNKQGQFLKVVRPSDDLFNASQSDDDKARNSPNYTPLPNDLREDPDYKSTFGRCRYVYYGRHSEGNRFIRNNDL